MQSHLSDLQFLTLRRFEEIGPPSQYSNCIKYHKITQLKKIFAGDKWIGNFNNSNDDLQVNCRFQNTTLVQQRNAVKVMDYCNTLLKIEKVIVLMFGCKDWFIRSEIGRWFGLIESNTMQKYKTVIVNIYLIWYIPARTSKAICTKHSLRYAQ